MSLNTYFWDAMVDGSGEYDRLYSASDMNKVIAMAARADERPVLFKKPTVESYTISALAGVYNNTFFEADSEEVTSGSGYVITLVYDNTNRECTLTRSSYESITPSGDVTYVPIIHVITKRLYMSLETHDYQQMLTTDTSSTDATKAFDTATTKSLITSTLETSATGSTTSNTKAYSCKATVTKLNTVTTNANNYTDTKVSSTIETSATGSTSSNDKVYSCKAVGTRLTTTLNSAKSHSDANLVTAKAYTDTKSEDVRANTVKTASTPIITITIPAGTAAKSSTTVKSGGIEIGTLSGHQYYRWLIPVIGPGTGTAHKNHLGHMYNDGSKWIWVNEEAVTAATTISFLQIIAFID